jgi:hypothetical protein
MPADARELRRGRICVAIFPFSPAFPLRLADGEELPDVEAWATRLRGAPAGVVAEARLRPVLLLHDRTRAGHGDALCLRISTVKPEHRRDPGLWERIERGEHPFYLLLRAAVGRYRLRADSLVSLLSLGTVHRSAILAPTGGALSAREMQLVSERLARVLELDLAPRVAALAHELLRRGGFVRAG